jgi:serine/threonine-protein kinase
MEARKARNLIRQIAEAVGEAHQHDIVHGTLGPDNVLLCSGSPTLSTKVLNLGVSAVSPRVHTDFVSPEYYLHKAIDARADVWSLAAIAFWLVMNEPPFDQNHRLMLEWSFIPPSARSDEPLPEDLDPFFEQAFSVVPADRFASMAETAEAFSNAILSTKRRPSVVDGVRLSRISRHHVLDVAGPKADGETSGSDDE